MTAPVPQFDGDTRPALEAQIIDEIVGEVMAQLEELSDDSVALCNAHGDEHYDRMTEMADDLRETLIVTVRQRVSDWVCDNATAAEALYMSDWHKAVSA